HDQLGWSVSKLKHAEKDEYFEWEVALLEAGGNERGNAKWEAAIPIGWAKPQPTSSPEARRVWVSAKYQWFAFVSDSHLDSHLLDEEGLGRLIISGGATVDNVHLHLTRKVDINKKLDRGLNVMQLAIALEGHPDNVVPALVGGCQLATTINPTSNPSHLITPISWHPSLTPIIAIPDFELSTQAARQVLPLQYPREDVIFNTSHLGLLIRALETKNPEWLRIALADRIHQPYRQALIPGYEQVHGAAIAAGAYGVVISGAGPSLLALVDQSQAAGVILAMEQAWLEVGLTSTVQAMTLDQGGATLIEPVHPMA
ncbi:MAG: homoserine kinase, partial [Cyanobacteria bacterium WB6_1B_304]|nr:homoserine kinase [Cyanobacteria bacterium WB6_1B_304]